MKEQPARPPAEYPPSKLWTYQGLADYAGVSKATLRRMVEAGQLEVVYCKGTPRITHGSFLLFIQRECDS